MRFEIPDCQALLPGARHRFLPLFLGLGLLLIFLLGHRGLNEPDEGRYANIALGLQAPGAHSWEPRMSHFGHYDKPPLTYWLTASAFRCFGRTEWAARLVPLAGACMTLGGLAWAARRLYGRETAWWAVLLCGTMGQFWLLARFLTPDMLLSGACTLAIAAWVEARARQGHWGFWALGVLCWSVAWWTKGTAALVPLAGLTAGLVAGGDAAGRKALRLPLTLLWVLALGLPWYLWLIAQYPELTGFFFGRELVGRIAGHPDGRQGPIYYHFLVILVAWLPWLPVIGAAVLLKRKLFLRSGWRGVRNALGIEGWIVLVGLIIYSLISSKLPTYTLPFAPWAALLLARALLRLRGALRRQNFCWLVTAPTVIAVAVFVVAAMLAPALEARLGSNSSLRPVSEELRRRGAQTVLLDRYWAGMEFYFGHRVHYVVAREPRQRRGETGFCPAIANTHFCRPEDWPQRVSRTPGPGIWLVHYTKDKQSPFREFIERNPKCDRATVGHFLLVRVR